MKLVELLKLIELLLKFLKPIQQWARRRYVPPRTWDPMGRLRPITLRNVLAFNSNRPFEAEGGILLLLLAGAFSKIQVDFHVRLFAGSCRPDFLLTPWPLVPYPLLPAIGALSALGIVLTFQLYRNHSKLATISRLFLLAAVLSLIPIVAYRWMDSTLVSRNTQAVRKLADTYYEASEFVPAYYLYQQLVASPTRDVRDMATPRNLAIIYLMMGNYQDAIRTTCSIHVTDKDSADRLGQIIRSSIYNLAHIYGDKDAVDQVNTALTYCPAEYVPALSLVWAYIHPSIWLSAIIDPFQQDGPWIEQIRSVYQPLPGSAHDSLYAFYSPVAATPETFSADQRRLADYATHHPEDTSVDVALFMQRDYRSIIVYHQNSPLLDKAYYGWGLQAFASKDYPAAISRFSSFLAAFRSHKWRDDALWRIAKAYLLMNDPESSLRYLDMASSEPNADKFIYNVCIECDISYVSGVTMSGRQLHEYLDTSMNSNATPIIRISIAEDLLAHERYTEALGAFSDVCLSVDEKTVGSWGNLPQAFQEECTFKLEAVAKIVQLSADGSPAGKLRLAQFFLAYPQVLENTMWFRSTITWPKVVPGEYFVLHSARVRAAELIESALRDDPLRPDRANVLEQAAQALDAASADSSLTDAATIEALRQSALRLYRELLAQLPPDSPQFDRTFANIGYVYLRRGDLSKPIASRYSTTDVASMIREFSQLAEQFPTHHLADEALNWVAWGYCYIANSSSPLSSEYVDNYSRALQVYQRIVRDYPTSSPASWARDNIATIQRKLDNPTFRRPVDPARW